MAKTQVQTRLDADDMDRLEEYRNEKEVTKAEAVRRLVRRGLRSEGYANTETRQFGQAVAFTTLWRGGVLLALLILLASEVGGI